MAQKREKESTDLKLRPPTPISVPQPQFPSSRLSENTDPKPIELVETRPGSGSDNTSEKIDPVISSSDEVKRTSLKRPREVCRCSGSGCRKRVGLMGFRCRCGEVFCSEHRYSDRHDCGYDYKAAGRETIARENPVVKAVKLVKV